MDSAAILGSGKGDNKRVLGTNWTCVHTCFWQELELLPTKEIQQNIYIKHPVSIEQYLMEGSYNKAWFMIFHIVLQYWEVLVFHDSLFVEYQTCSSLHRALVQFTVDNWETKC